MGESKFIKITERMIGDSKDRMAIATKEKDWGRLLTLEGFKSGLEQALDNYYVTIKET